MNCFDDDSFALGHFEVKGTESFMNCFDHDLFGSGHSFKVEGTEKAVSTGTFMLDSGSAFNVYLELDHEINWSCLASGV